MNCPTNETLERLALGFLEDEAPVRAHAAACAACAAALKSLSGDHAALAAASKDVPLPRLSRPKPRSRWLRSAVALAACALVAVGVLAVVQPSAMKPAAPQACCPAPQARLPEAHRALVTKLDPPAPPRTASVDDFSTLDRAFSGRRDPFSKPLSPENPPAPAPAPPADATHRLMAKVRIAEQPGVVRPRPAMEPPKPMPKPEAPPRDMFFENAGVNPFKDIDKETQSTFAMDVDTASYTLVRNYLNRRQLPPAAAVRVEECLNYFRYGDQPPPKGDFALRLEVAPSPFRPGLHLLRVAVLAREIADKDRKDATLVFVVDISGSMAQENRLELVKRSLRFLVESLRLTDRIGIVVYGSTAYKLLDPTPVSSKGDILRVIDGLRTQGSTNAGAGLLEGYRMADAAFDAKRTNRVVLCSDGVANVGITGPDDILKSVEDHSVKGVQLSTLGFGMGNYNDVLMEKLADKGNGNYAYIDDFDEAKKIFSEKLAGMLEVVAADAKVQVEFDAKTVARFRLLGYENRHVANKDFRNDKIDAGEVGAGHRVSALYEVALKPGEVGRLATVRLRYKDPDTKEVPELQESISAGQVREKLAAASPSLQLAAAVAEFAEILRGSEHVRGTKMDAVLEVARPAVDGLDRPQDAVDFLELIKAARDLGK